MLQLMEARRILLSLHENALKKRFSNRISNERFQSYKLNPKDENVSELMGGTEFGDGF